MIGYFDGASRGNPGDAGAGACLVNAEGQVVWESYNYLGKKTNNEAEYQALIDLLDEVRARQLSEIEVRGDSQLVVSQVNKEWKINKAHLRALAEQVWQRTAHLSLKLRWIPREQNKLADELSNRAIDCREKAKEKSQEKTAPQEPANALTVGRRVDLVLEVLGGAVVSEVAQREGLSPDQLSLWVLRGREALLKSQEV